MLSPLCYPYLQSSLFLPGGNHCDELHTKLIISYFYYKHLHSHALLFFKDLRIYILWLHSYEVIEWVKLIHGRRRLDCILPEAKWRLTGSGYERTFRGNGNFLYHVWDGVTWVNIMIKMYLILCLRSVLFTVYKFNLN